MRTINSRKLCIDKLSMKTAMSIYMTMPSIRGLVHKWYDGNPSDLINQKSFLRRLVVRAIRELEASASETIN